MSERKFRIGQQVNYRPSSRNQDAPGGIYMILAFLPQRADGEAEYRIKNLNEQNERVASESELRSA